MLFGQVHYFKQKVFMKWHALLEKRGYRNLVSFHG